MTDRMTATPLADGTTLHLQDGPLTLTVGLDASPGAVAAAHKAAIVRFRSLADEIEEELPTLREPADHGSTRLTGSVARRAWRAVRPFAASGFITPLAAIRGAVAEEILAAAMASADTARIFVNFSGHVALHLTPGHGFRAGLADGADLGAPFTSVEVRVADPVRGIGVSGRAIDGSSRGIADAVTVLAQTAAKADVAAMLIANAVDLPEHPGVRRSEAVLPNSGHLLGERTVVTDLAALEDGDILQALATGKAVADDLVARGLVASACLRFAGRTASSGAMSFSSAAEPVERRRAAR